MAGIGILFDIGELDGGLYGAAAYRIFFEAINPYIIKRCALKDGDTNATLRGIANQYCIAVESPDINKINYIKKTMESCTAKGLAPLSERFIDEPAVLGEPLVFAGRIDSEGNMTGCETSWVLSAWEKALSLHEAPQNEGAAMAAVVVPADHGTSLPKKTAMYAFMLHTKNTAHANGLFGLAFVNMRSLDDWKEKIREQARCPDAEVVIIEPEQWNPPEISDFSQTELGKNQAFIFRQVQKSIDLLGLPKIEVNEMINNGFYTGSAASGRLFYVYKVEI